VGEGGGGGGVRQVIGRHVDGLHGSDGALLGGGNAFLQGTQVSGQGGLVTDGGGHAAQQGRHLRAGLREAEDVVHEEEHILPSLVTEVLRHGQPGEADAGAGSRGFVHLSVDQRGLGFAIQFDDATLNHLVVQVVTLAGALADAGEDGETAVGLGDVVDELHNEHGLANTGTAEQADLTTLGVGRQQVHDLDARYQHLGLCGLLGEGGGVSVNRPLGGGFDGSALIDGVAHHVHDAAEGLGAHGDRDGSTQVGHGLAAHQTVGGVEGNATHHVVTQMLGNLERAAGLTLLHLQAVHNAGQIAVLEDNIQDGTHDLGDFAGGGESATGDLVLLHLLHGGRLASLRISLQLLSLGNLCADLLKQHFLVGLELLNDLGGSFLLGLLTLGGRVFAEGEVVVVRIAE